MSEAEKLVDCLLHENYKIYRASDWWNREKRAWIDNSNSTTAVQTLPHLKPMHVRKPNLELGRSFKNRKPYERQLNRMRSSPHRVIGVRHGEEGTLVSGSGSGVVPRQTLQQGATSQLRARLGRRWRSKLDKEAVRIERTA